MHSRSSTEPVPCACVRRELHQSKSTIITTRISIDVDAIKAVNSFHHFNRARQLTSNHFYSFGGDGGGWWLLLLLQCALNAHLESRHSAHFIIMSHWTITHRILFMRPDSHKISCETSPGSIIIIIARIFNMHTLPPLFALSQNIWRTQTSTHDTRTQKPLMDSYTRLIWIDESINVDVDVDVCCDLFVFIRNFVRVCVRNEVNLLLIVVDWNIIHFPWRNPIWFDWRVVGTGYGVRRPSTDNCFSFHFSRNRFNKWLHRNHAKKVALSKNRSGRGNKMCRFCCCASSSEWTQSNKSPALRYWHEDNGSETTSKQR